MNAHAAAQEEITFNLDGRSYTEAEIRSLPLEHIDTFSAEALRNVPGYIYTDQQYFIVRAKQMLTIKKEDAVRIWKETTYS